MHGGSRLRKQNQSSQLTKVTYQPLSEMAQTDGLKAATAENPDDRQNFRAKQQDTAGFRRLPGAGTRDVEGLRGKRAH